ncbi:MAG TPA: biotin transporter BioY [Phycisphaerales bacterium]|nr:biotin transporter BioY [Phycisphaerales bacterium]
MNHSTAPMTSPAPQLAHSPAATQTSLRIAGVLGFAALTALCAQITFPIPGTPVPVTLQTLPVTLAACALGARLGAVSMALYLLVGLLGLPVFADASGGVTTILGKTGGYLFAFMLVPPLTAFALRSRNNTSTGWRGVIGQVVLANLVIFTLGVAWLRLFVPTWDAALVQGLYPFLPGTIIKSAMAVLLGAAIAPWAMRRVW